MLNKVLDTKFYAENLKDFENKVRNILKKENIETSQIEIIINGDEFVVFIKDRWTLSGSIFDMENKEGCESYFFV